MRIFLIVLFLTYSTASSALIKFSPTELKNIAVKYLNLKNRLQQPNPSNADINRFMDLLASDLKTEVIFPDIEPVISDKKAVKQRALLDIQNEFEYSEIEILEFITGYNFVIVKFNEKSKHKGKLNYYSSDSKKKTLVLDDNIEGELTMIVTIQINQKGLIEFISKRIG